MVQATKAATPNKYDCLKSWPCVQKEIVDTLNSSGNNDVEELAIQSGLQTVLTIRHPRDLKCIASVPGTSGDTFVTQYSIGVSNQVSVWTIPKGGSTVKSIRYDVPTEIRQLLHIQKYRVFAAFCGDMTLRIYSDVSHSFNELSVTPCPYHVVSMCYLAHGDEVVTGGLGCLLRWKASHYRNGLVLHGDFNCITISRNELVIHLDVDHDENLLLVQTEGSVMAIDYLNGSLVHTFESRDDYTITRTLVYKPSDYFISAYVNGMLKVWHRRVFQQVHEFRGHQRPVSSLLVHGTEPLLLSGSMDGTIRIWRLDTLEPQQRIDIGEPVLGMRWLSETTIAYWTETDIRICKINLFHRLFSAIQSGVVSISRWATDAAGGARIVVCAEDGSIRMLCPVTGDAITIVYPLPSYKVPTGIVYDRQQEQLYAFVEEEVWVFDCTSNPCRLQYKLRTPTSPLDDTVLCITLFKQVQSGARKKEPQSLIFAGHKDGSVSLMYGGRASMAAPVQAHQTAVVMLRTSVPLDSHDHLPLLGEHPHLTRQQSPLVREHSGPLASESRLVSCAANGQLKVWAVTTGVCPLDISLQLLKTLVLCGVPKDFSLMGSVLCYTLPSTGTLKFVLLRDEPNQSVRCKLRDHGVTPLPHRKDDDHTSEVNGLDCCPDLQLFATAGNDAHVKIWSMSGQLIRELVFDGFLRGVCFANARGDLLVGFGNHVHYVSITKYLPVFMLEKIYLRMYKDMPKEKPLAPDVDFQTSLGYDEVTTYHRNSAGRRGSLVPSDDGLQTRIQSFDTNNIIDAPMAGSSFVSEKNNDEDVLTTEEDNDEDGSDDSSKSDKDETERNAKAKNATLAKNFILSQKYGNLQENIQQIRKHDDITIDKTAAALNEENVMLSLAPDGYIPNSVVRSTMDMPGDMADDAEDSKSTWKLNRKFIKKSTHVNNNTTNALEDDDEEEELEEEDEDKKEDEQDEVFPSDKCIYIHDYGDPEEPVLDFLEALSDAEGLSNTDLMPEVPSKRSFEDKLPEMMDARTPDIMTLVSKMPQIDETSDIEEEEESFFDTFGRDDDSPVPDILSFDLKPPPELLSKAKSSSNKGKPVPKKSGASKSGGGRKDKKSVPRRGMNNAAISEEYEADSRSSPPPTLLLQIATEPWYPDSGHTNLSGVTDALCNVIKKANVDVNEEICSYFGQINDELSFPAPLLETVAGSLMEQLRHRDSMFRRQAVRTLGQLPVARKDVLLAMMTLLKDRMGEVREEARNALARLLGDDTKDGLLNMLQDMDVIQSYTSKPDEASTLTVLAQNAEDEDDHGASYLGQWIAGYNPDDAEMSDDDDFESDGETGKTGKKKRKSKKKHSSNSEKQSGKTSKAKNAGSRNKPNGSRARARRMSVLPDFEPEPNPLSAMRERAATMKQGLFPTNPRLYHVYHDMKKKLAEDPAFLTNLFEDAEAGGEQKDDSALSTTFGTDTDPENSAIQAPYLKNGSDSGIGHSSETSLSTAKHTTASTGSRFASSHVPRLSPVRSQESIATAVTQRNNIVNWREYFNLHRQNLIVAENDARGKGNTFIGTDMGKTTLPSIKQKHARRDKDGMSISKCSSVGYEQDQIPSKHDRDTPESSTDASTYSSASPAMDTSNPNMGVNYEKPELYSITKVLTKQTSRTGMYFSSCAPFHFAEPRLLQGAPRTRVLRAISTKAKVHMADKLALENQNTSRARVFAEGCDALDTSTRSRNGFASYGVLDMHWTACVGGPDDQAPFLTHRGCQLTADDGASTVGQAPSTTKLHSDIDPESASNATWKAVSKHIRLPSVEHAATDRHKAFEWDEPLPPPPTQTGNKLNRTESYHFEYHKLWQKKLHHQRLEQCCFSALPKLASRHSVAAESKKDLTCPARLSSSSHLPPVTLKMVFVNDV